MESTQTKTQDIVSMTILLAIVAALLAPTATSPTTPELFRITMMNRIAPDAAVTIISSLPILGYLTLLWHWKEH